MAHLTYSTVGTNKLDEAKAFYDALLGSIGIGTVFDHPSGGRIYGRDGKLMFGVLSPYDKTPATAGNGAMSGFSFDTCEEIDQFHAKALALGATDDGAPGDRAPGFYFSYFRDLDGNKICGFRVG